MTGFVFRPIAEEERDLARGVIAASPDAGSLNDGGGGAAWGLWIRDALAGVVCLKGAPDGVEVTGWCVLPAHRGLGFGKWILSGAAAWARERGGQVVTVRTLSSPAAAAALASSGFREAENAVWRLALADG